MKKIICLVVVVVSLLSVSVCVNAAVMTKEQQNELTNLSIMTGDPNGDLRLNDTITRAEAIKMICVAGNIGTSVIETNAFPDVPENHWAYSYIAAAKANGLVNGDENGNCNPENDVTNEEIVKMLDCLLGYGPMASTLSGYPAGYTAVAAKIGLTKDMCFSVDTPAIRNDVGILILNALDIPLMTEKTSAEDSNAIEYVIMDGSDKTQRLTLKNRFEKYDSSRDNISKLSKAFASQYLYKEGDTEKSFALYPDITYTSGIEKTADGKEYECPAIYDDLMVPELVNGTKKDTAKFFINGTEPVYSISYAVFKEKMLVPVYVFGFAGCNVQFDETRYVAAISKNSTVLEILPNMIGMRKNQAEGFWVPLEVCARFIDNTLYVPIDAVASEFGMTAVWDSDANTITLQP